jgi:hypothetical protein
MSNASLPPPVFLAFTGIGGVGADFDRAYGHVARVCGSSFILPVRIVDDTRAVLISRSHAQLVGGWHPSLSPRCNAVLTRAGEASQLWRGIAASGFLTLSAAQIAVQSGALWSLAPAQPDADSIALEQEFAGADLAVHRIAVGAGEGGMDEFTGHVPDGDAAPEIDLRALLAGDGPVRIALCGRDLDGQSSALRAVRRALAPGRAIDIHVAADQQGREAGARDIPEEGGAGPVRVIGVEAGDAWRDHLARDWDIVIAGDDFRPAALPLASLRMRALVLPAPRLAGRLALRQEEARPAILTAASPPAPDFAWYVNESAPGMPFRIAAAEYRRRGLVPQPVSATDPAVALAAACQALAAATSRAGFIRWTYDHARAVTALMAERSFRNFFTLFTLAREEGGLAFDAGLRLETGIAILDWLHDCPPAELRERAYQLFLGRAYDGTNATELSDTHPMADRVKFLRDVFRSGRCATHVGAWRQACLAGTIERLSAHMDARALYDDSKIGRYIRFVGLEGTGKPHKSLEIEDLVIASCRRYRG